MTTYFIISIGLILLVAFIYVAIIRKKLTPLATLLALFIGFSAYQLSGLTGIALLFTFFGSAVWASAHQADKKQINLRDRTRNLRQVWANGGFSLILFVLSLLFPGSSLDWSLLFASGIAAATSDTLSSELGIVYGRRNFNVLSFRKAGRGENGAVSAEGLSIGLFASFAIALVYFLSPRSASSLIIITACGMAGNLADSFAGALWENKSYIGNNTVNFIGTSTAVLLAAAACYLL